MDAKEMLEVSRSGIATYINSQVVPEMIKRAQKGFMTYYASMQLDPSMIGYLKLIGYKVTTNNGVCISWNND